MNRHHKKAIAAMVRRSRDAQQIEEVINKYGLNDLPEATVQSILEHMRGLADWHREQAGGKSKS